MYIRDVIHGFLGMEALLDGRPSHDIYGNRRPVYNPKLRSGRRPMKA
jgi:hypothetical protein